MKCNPETDGIYTARNYTTAIQTKQVSAEAADISISERSSISERGQPGMPAHRPWGRQPGRAAGPGSQSRQCTACSHYVTEGQSFFSDSFS